MLVLRPFRLSTGTSVQFRILSCTRSTFSARLYSSHSSLPRIASASLWSSLIPKPFRRSNKDGSATTAQRSRDWNPATFFIVISLLIGSNAIQLVSLKTHQLNYNRDTDAKLSLLREVIDRVQRGEDVNVEAMLGKGDPEREKEWEEMMKDLEREEDVWAKKQAKRNGKASSPRIFPSNEEAEASSVEVSATSEVEQEGKDRKPGFY